MTRSRHLAFVLIVLLGISTGGRAQGQSGLETQLNAGTGRHTELGINVGTPGGINLSIGQWFDRWGIRASGMTYGSKMRGIQGFAGYEFLNDSEHRHAIGLAVGTWDYQNNSWTYAGPAYDLSIGGFFMEFGIAWGHGTYAANQVIWQIGYVYRLFDK